MSKIIMLLLLATAATLHAQWIDSACFSTRLFPSDSANLFFRPSLLDSILQDKRVILLGELDHGDGTSFEIKTALIKYLHEKHGFNRLAIEAGIISCDELWRNKLTGTTIADNAKNYIYYIWSQVKETEALFEYIDREFDGSATLKIVGIDPQFSGSEGERVFIKLLQAKLPDSEVNSNRFQAFLHELRIMSNWLHYPGKDEHQISEALFLEYLDYYREKIVPDLKSEEAGLWQLYFDNVKTLASIKWEKREKSFELRDQQMFKNLTYWLDAEPAEKIIVWAANAHIIRNDKQLQGKDRDYKIIGIRKLGDHIFSAYPNDAYSIAVAAGTGATLNFPSIKRTTRIAVHKSTSLEERLKTFGTSFVDLRRFEKAMHLNEYESGLFYTNVECTSRWSHHFDGIIFIPNMKPSTPKW